MSSRQHNNCKISIPLREKKVAATIVLKKYPVDLTNVACNNQRTKKAQLKERSKSSEPINKETRKASKLPILIGRKIQKSNCI